MKDGLATWFRFLRKYNRDWNIQGKIDQLELQLLTPYHPKYPNGITGYIDFLQNTWAEMDTADPDYLHHTLVSDSRKMLYVRNRLNATDMARRVYDAYERHHRGGTFDDFLQDMYNWMDYRTMGDQRYAQRQARNANTAPVESSVKGESQT